MTRHVNDLVQHAQPDLEWLLQPVTVGTADKQRTVPRFALAIENIKNWTPDDPGAAGFERGGSSSATEADDRHEANRLAQQVARDSIQLPHLVKVIVASLDELVRLTARNAETVHPDKLPSDEEAPGCRSCARTGYGKGAPLVGHFAPVREDVKGHKLCDWCYRHALAAANEAGRPIGRDYWPPIEACDIFHRQGPQAAGRWLAKLQSVAASA